MASGDTRVLVACPGVGRVQRGFETFARECHAALGAQDDVETWLAKGAGPRARREVVVASIDRRGTTARVLAPLVRDPPDIPGVREYLWEEVSFALALVPVIRRLRPDVVLFSDPHVGSVLDRLRRVLPASLRLLFSNGAPLPPPYPRYDHVQHTTQETHAAALAAGLPPGRHTLLPYGFTFDAHPRPTDRAAVAALRRRLGYPLDRPVVLSVGAMNAFHKRMDYVIREIADLPEPRPHLVILGDRVESAAVERLAEGLLGPSGVTLGTATSSEMGGHYDAADAFVLASLDEGFGRVYVEALGRGLPCVAHDTPHTRGIFGRLGLLRDLRVRGAGGAAIVEALGQSRDPARVRARSSAARSAFAWDVLGPRYAELVARCAADGPVAAAPR